MKEFSYVIKDTLGIHARPAGQFIKIAEASGCAVKISKDGKSADAKRIMAVLGLCIKKGDEVKVTVEGDKETETVALLEDFFNENL